MTSLLHITNGDSFTNKLHSLGLKEDVITWREMLCEGKTLTTVGSEPFWKTRYEFLHKNYKVTKSWFIEKTLKEYRSLCNHKQQDQIVLWFDYDLFCQINMLAIISWLKINRKYAQITIVSSRKKRNYDTLYRLKDLSNKELLDLYENRTILNQDDIEYADYVWQLYCSDSPIRLENLTDFKNYNFDYLSDAITHHLHRFPSLKNGLNALENSILKIALEQKPSSKIQLLNIIIDNQSGLGFGDSQYERVINKLMPLFSSLNPVLLAKKGKDILENTTNYYGTIQDNDFYLGGALKYSFLYNNTANKLLKL